MAFRGAFWVAALVVAAAAYGAYAPDDGGSSSSPTPGAYAHRLHDMAFGRRAEGGGPDCDRRARRRAGRKRCRFRPRRSSAVDFPIVIEGLGQVQAYNNVTVRARVDGQIMKIGFREGDDVKAGDLIAADRPASLPGGARPGQSEEGPGRSQPRQRQARPAALFDARQAELRDPAAARHAERAGRAADRADRRRRRPRSTPPRCNSTTRRSARRFPAASDLRLIDEGNLVSGSQQTAIVTIAQLEPISVIFTMPETRIGGIAQALSSGEAAGRRHRHRRQGARDRQAHDHGQPGRRHQRHARLKAEFANRTTRFGRASRSPPR